MNEVPRARARAGTRHRDRTQATSTVLGARRRGPRLRADFRLARRQAWRTKWSSLLVVLLVALPVAGLFGGATFLESRTPSASEATTLTLGRAQSLLIAVVPVPKGFTQAIDDPRAWQSSERVGAEAWGGSPPTAISSLVPSDAEVIELQRFTSRVKTATGIASVTRIDGNAWDPALDGAFRMISGSAPASRSQAMATPALLTRIGVEVGGTVTLPDSGTTLTITGALQARDAQEFGDTVLFTSAGAVPASDVDASERQWYISDWQPEYAQFAALNQSGYGVFARDVVLDPPAEAIDANGMRSASSRWGSYAIGAVAAVASGFLVTLLAGAAFAVSTRRQQRALAVAASVGAAHGDVFRIVVLQGVVLGLAGGLLGAALGSGAVAIALSALDPGVQGLFWSSFGFRVPWDAGVAIILFAILIGAVSALAPARAATRGDILGSLRGARRPAVLHRRLPVGGLTVLIGGAAISVVGAGIAAVSAFGTAAANADPERSQALLVVSLWMMIAGPLIMQVGIILSGRALLRGVARLLSGIGLAPRLAGRDAAANPSRTVPAFTAITASVFIATFVLSSMALTDGGGSRRYSWSAPLGGVVASISGSDPKHVADAEREARRLLAGTDPDEMFTVSTPRWPDRDPQTGTPDPTSTLLEYRLDVAGCKNACDGAIWIATPEAVRAMVGERISAHDEDALRSGGVLLFPNESFTADATTAALKGFPPGTLGGSYTGTEIPTVSHDLPVTVVGGTRSRYGTIITPQTAERLGIEFQVVSLVATYRTPPDVAVMDRLTADTETASTPTTTISVIQEQGPAPVAPWLSLVTGVTALIVLGAAGISLGLSRFERRADDATLAAVGGSVLLRRHVNAWQAVIVAGLGSALGVLSGLFPAWSLVQSQPHFYRLSDVPGWWLLALAIGLPLFVAVLAWAVRPRRAELGHRTAIA